MKNKTILFSLLSSFLLQPSAFPQGPLPPPGPPGPTMKALDQIASTGIPLDAKHVSTADSNYEFVISQAGTYFLTGNLDVTRTHGIHVTTPGVTIDLNGFELRRRTAGSGDGIMIDSSASGCRVRNGSITGFQYGVQAGIATPARGGSYSDLVVSACTTSGLQAGTGWLVERCSAHDNLNSTIGALSGFGEGAVYVGCSAVNNQGVGMSAGFAATMRDCTANNNGLDGIVVGRGGIVEHCSAVNNTGNGFYLTTKCLVANSNASNNNGHGITASDVECVVKDCLVVGNKTHGISVVTNSVVTRNNCSSNGTNSQGGIAVTGSGCRVEENNSNANQNVGIIVTNPGNIILKNTCRGNATTNFNIVAGNSVGDILNVYNGGAGATITSSNPWANFQY